MQSQKEIVEYFLYCFTAHLSRIKRGSLRSLEPQSAQRLFILLFSVDPALSGTGTPENNKNHALRAVRTQKYRVVIDFFLLLSPLLC